MSALIHRCRHFIACLPKHLCGCIARIPALNAKAPRERTRRESRLRATRCRWRCLPGGAVLILFPAHVVNSKKALHLTRRIMQLPSCVISGCHRRFGSPYSGMQASPGIISNCS